MNMRVSVQLSRLTLLALLAATALALASCGDDATLTDTAESDASADAGPVHIHGLGTNPTDGALFIATHSGVWRLPDGSDTASRVSDRQQDTMGFAVVGSDHFVGSGHPGEGEDLPPYLGFVESSDGGRSWRQVSLLGEFDFHVLEVSGRRVYGFGSNFQAREAQLLISDNLGRDWSTRDFPEPFVSLAIDPDDSKIALASGERKLHLTTDAGHSWKSVQGDPGLLAWRQDGIFLVDAEGTVATARRPGASWSELGTIGDPPAAFDVNENYLFVALHDGSIEQSRDGSTWTTRYRP